MVKAAADQSCVLRMVGVRAQPWFLGAELTVRAGRCVAIRAGAAAAEYFADLVQGLAVPGAGTVEVCGEAWRTLSVPATYALRARVGRLAPRMHWIQNLNVDENVMLPMLDRSRVPEPDLRARARVLAQQFGLAELPRSRPHATSAADLLASAAVRAFLGTPAVVVVEPLLRDASASLRAGLAVVVRAACAAGTAVLWLSAEALDFECDGHGELGPDALLAVASQPGSGR